MRPLFEAVTDGADVIMRRIYVDLAFQRTKCILHRKYLLLARTDDRYVYSRSQCTEAALKMLHCQVIFDGETQAGGRLYEYRKRASSLVKIDFLLAATILCVDVYHTLTMTDDDLFQQDLATEKSNEDVIHALQTSYHIWRKSTNSSREAQKAATVLRFVLTKVQEKASESSSSILRFNDMNATDSESASIEASLRTSSLSAKQFDEINFRLITPGPIAMPDLLGPDSVNLSSFAEEDFDTVSQFPLYSESNMRLIHN